MDEINYQDFKKIFLRFFSKTPHYHGTMTIKWYNGDISNVKIEDSVDTNEIKDKILILNEEMFVKKGASFPKDDKSSKIISAIEMDADKKIVKESNIKEEKEKKDESNEDK